jgi:light-regulated signal transduction histidine kinase (bacteriophytochrome)
MRAANSKDRVWGLAICGKIVERHAGHIDAEGTPGEVAAFIVTLPKKQPA